MIKMEELDYRTKTKRGTIKKKYVLHGKTYSDPDDYYGAVYEDIVEYKRIDTAKIKSDQDLKRFLEGDPKISDKLVNKLQRSSYHQELMNINLEKEGAYRLKNKKVVKVAGKTTVRGTETYYYKDMLVIAHKQRSFYRDVRTGRFVTIR